MYDIIFGKHKTECINHALSRFNDGTGVRCFNSWNGQKCSRCVGLTAVPTLSKGELAITLEQYRRLIINPDKFQHKGQQKGLRSLTLPQCQQKDHIMKQLAPMPKTHLRVSSRTPSDERLQKPYPQQIMLHDSERRWSHSKEHVKSVVFKGTLTYHPTNSQAVQRCDQSCPPQNSSHSVDPSNMESITSTPSAFAATPHRSTTAYIRPLIPKELVAVFLIH
jgi:hypothetical protein